MEKQIAGRQPLSFVRDWQGRNWRLGERVQLPSFGCGRIESFVSASLAYVTFDDPRAGVRGVRLADLTRVTKEEERRCSS